MKPEPVTRDIFRVGGSGITSPDDAAVYLIQAGDTAALVDAGCGSAHDRLINAITACGTLPEQVEMLLLTHCHFDHTGGADAVRKTCGCAITAHELDAAFLERGDSLTTAASWYGTTLPAFTVDRKLSGTETVLQIDDRTIRAIHTPGHSPGSIVFMVESDGRQVLFGQDVHGPLHPDLQSDPDAYRQSLERMMALEADILCEGHYGIIRGAGEVRRFIRSFIA